MPQAKFAFFLFALFSVSLSAPPASDPLASWHPLTLSPSSEALEASARPITCPKYACATTTLPANTCISLTNSTYSLSLCTSALTPYCSQTLTGSVSVCQAPPTPSPLQAYVGQYCNVTVACTYGTCSNSKCVGKEQGGTCTSHNDCDVGLRCAGTTCIPVLRVGTTGCVKDEECELKAGCNHLMGSQKGVCEAYFSLEEGAIATDCASNRSRLCKSGMCRTVEGLLSKQSYCISAPVLNGTLPLACTAHVNCTGVSRPWEYSGTCSCGYNPSGTAYCSLFPGDQPYVLALTTLASLLDKQTFFACNTARRFQPDCLSTVDAALYQTYRMQSLFAEFYPQLQGNDNCVQKIYTSYYWTKSGWVVSLAALLWV